MGTKWYHHGFIRVQQQLQAVHLGQNRTTLSIQFTFAKTTAKRLQFSRSYIKSHKMKSCWEAEKQVGQRPVMNLKQCFECPAQTTCPWLELVRGTMCWQQLISARSLGQAESSPKVTGCNELPRQSLHTPSSCALAAHSKQSRVSVSYKAAVDTKFGDKDKGRIDVWVPLGLV